MDRNPVAILVLVSILLIAGAESVRTTQVWAFSSPQDPALELGQPNFATYYFPACGSSSSIKGNAVCLPQGLALDRSGALWVADSGNDRILRFSPPFRTRMNFSLGLNHAWGSGDHMSNPPSVAFDSAGNLWVADWGEARVLRFSPPFSDGMNASVQLGGYLVNSVAFDSLGNMWVLDDARYQVQVYAPPFTSRSTPSITIGRAPISYVFLMGAECLPAAADTFCGPANLAFDSTGNVWVADTSNNRVLRFSPPFHNGTSANLVLGQPNFTATTAPRTFALNQLGEPRGLAFDSKGDLWVAEGYSSVLMFSPPFSNGMNASFTLSTPQVAS